MKFRGKRGELLVENIIFIILNLIYFSILVIFLIKQGSGAVLLEDSYAKNIALLIDSARPSMVMHLNLQSLKEVSDKNGVPFSDVVNITGNYVTVKLSEKGGTSYQFFNNIDVNTYPEKDSNTNNYDGFYVFTFDNPK